MPWLSPCRKELPAASSPMRPGLGSAPIAAAAAQTKEPARQGLVTMTGTFIDTIVICTMTGLSIVPTDLEYRTGRCPLLPPAHSDGTSGTGTVFRISLLMMCLIFFAFTTIIGWDYYGERCLGTF